MTIVDIQDRFLDPKNDGYRDMLLNLEVNGHVAELQLHLEDVVEVKEGPGHELYEQKREIWEQASDDGRQLTKEEEQRVQKLDEQMREHYNEALA